MQKELNSNKLNNKGISACVIALVLIPITIFVAWNFFDRNYFVTSLLIIVYSMVPFFVMFEKRKPQARELVTIAVMCAIAVASRAAFIWIDHFKPMAAIIIITAIALGAEAGFLTGSLSVVVSNMIFGQGPWTPWQMFAFGFAGFLAGLFFRLKIIDKSKIKLCVFGAVIMMLVVGPILDTSTFFITAAEINTEWILFTYLRGMPVNAMQTLATVLTLWFFSQPLFEKLDRLKTKYGMMEG
ncbi:MAG: ECF transporter S component [Oscillospiraceae bacterium]|nr:ECF transporter S component [Oscillospiraceae bacterium]